MFRSAPEVEKIGTDLIRTEFDHKDLADVRVEYVFRDKAQKSAGRIVLGTARKIGGLSAFLAAHGDASHLGDPEPFFVIVIALDTWEVLDAKQRRALIDHELMHCKVTEDEGGGAKLATRGHDLEEFASIVERHGLWSSNVAAFGSVVAEQLALAVEEVSTFLENIDIDRKVDPETGEIEPPAS